eukprot:COSAG01_NODE_1183_length_11346_cov_263.800302_2_plen_80_part_00
MQVFWTSLYQGRSLERQLLQRRLDYQNFAKKASQPQRSTCVGKLFDSFARQARPSYDADVQSCTFIYFVCLLCCFFGMV